MTTTYVPPVWITVEPDSGDDEAPNRILFGADRTWIANTNLLPGEYVLVPVTDDGSIDADRLQELPL